MLQRLLHNTVLISDLTHSQLKDDGIRDYDLTHLHPANTTPATPRAVGILDRGFASEQTGPRCSVYSITMGLQMAALRNHHFIDVRALNRLTDRIWTEATCDRDPKLLNEGITKAEAMQSFSRILRSDANLNLDFEEVGALTFVSGAVPSSNSHKLSWRMNPDICTPIKDLNLQVLGSFVYWPGSDISGLTKSIVGHAVAVHSINFEQHWTRVVDGNVKSDLETGGIVVHEIPFEDITDDSPEQPPQIIFYRAIDVKNKSPLTLWNLVQNIPWDKI